MSVEANKLTMDKKFPTKLTKLVGSFADRPTVLYADTVYFADDDEDNAITYWINKKSEWVAVGGGGGSKRATIRVMPYNYFTQRVTLGGMTFALEHAPAGFFRLKPSVHSVLKGHGKYYRLTEEKDQYLNNDRGSDSHVLGWSVDKNTSNIKGAGMLRATNVDDVADCYYLSWSTGNNEEMLVLHITML